MGKVKQIVILFFPLLLLFVCSIAISAQNKDSSLQKGWLDLRTKNLSTVSVALDGEWAFYWKQLLTPNNIDTAKSISFVRVPQKWSETIVGGKKLSSLGFGTYRLKVRLQNASFTKKLAIYLPDTYSSYRVFVNGRFFAESGTPDSTAEKTIHQWLHKTVALDVEADTLDIIMQVANFKHAKGGPYKSIIIGNSETLFAEREANIGFDLFLTGCLFMGGLFFMGLYLFGKHDKAILYFSLFCITYSYRIIGSNFYVLHSMFQHMPWSLGIHLEYLSLFLSVIFFTLYTWYLYPEEAMKTIFKLQIAICVLLSLIVLIFSPLVFTHLITPFLLVMFSVLGFTFYVYYKAMQKKRVGAQYAMGSTTIAFFVFLVINLQYFGVIYPEKIFLFIGYISFFFLQSLILSFRFAYILKKAKKEAEQGLLAKSEFLSTMSHEIRTPLNSVLGITNLMLRDNPSIEQKEQLNMMLFSANNLLNIVNDILDYNKMEAGKIKFEAIEMDIKKIARNTIGGLKIAALEKGIDLQLIIDDKIQFYVLGDPTRTSQVLGNLIHNAIKFTRRGYVKLSVQVVSTDKKNATLRFAVEDTGIGIPVEKQRIIFERFSQADASTSRNFGGTGLGLAICKKLLDLQGATLQLKSEPEKGSVFYFDIAYPIIPIAVTIETTTASLPSEESKPLKNIHILLVEDNEVNILVAKAFLDKWGAITEVATNGKEGVDKIDPLRHKLVLLDIHMPVMDGYQATIEIRKRGITIPIIALTASLAHDVDAEARYSGIDAIIVKPFVPTDLFRHILHYTGIHRSL
jgi:signal transduction histidine kinase/CheY-like chemotaxis protein